MNAGAAMTDSVVDEAEALAADAGRAAAMSPRDLQELLGAFNDVTVRLQSAHEVLQGEVRRLRAELREANEQLERSRRLAALGEMAAGIAHEVRNPLGSIRLYGRMLEEDLDAAGMDEQRAVAGKILTAVRGLDGVVTDVLAFAREMRLEVVEVAASELFERAVEEALAGEERRAGIRVERGDEAADRLVRCDPSLMHRALVNVVRNAVQAMDGGGGGKLSTAIATETLRWEDGRARPAVALRVMDTGPGIPAEALPRIFNPFFTTRAVGTGLGLAIVHRIVDAHGGRVGVRNAEGGGGAVVDLVLPEGSSA